MRLLDHYRQLHAWVQSHTAASGLAPTSADLAQALHCSERNLRLLLGRMQTQGWLRWTPGRGRGHRSRLELLQAPDTLALDHLGHLLEQGDLGQAFATLSPKQRDQLARRLPNYLGASQASQRSLRLPLARRLESLDPLSAFFRLEAYLVRQIFSRLTEFDPRTQQLAPALAHHWESEANATRWHFWLRPGVSFHDGSPLGPEEVRQTFLRLKRYMKFYRRLFDHIERIDVGSDLRVSFQLRHTDQLWPHCLATAATSIVPQRRNADFARLPVGSGAFRVTRHNPYQLTLQAFDDHFRGRPLLDQIDLWVIRQAAALDAPAGTLPDFDLQYGYSADDHSAAQTLNATEAGCSYLVPNPQCPQFRTQAQRLAWADWLAPEAIFPVGDPSRRMARGLLAQWQHRQTCAPENPPPVSRTPLRVVSGQSTEMQVLAQAVQRRLEAAGQPVQLSTLDNPQWVSRDWLGDADLVVTREVMFDDTDFGCFDWFAADNVFRHWLSPAVLRWLNDKLLAIQAEPNGRRRLHMHEAIGRRLVLEGWVMPISHEMQRVRMAPHVAGARITPFGYVAFSELWIRA